MLSIVKGRMKSGYMSVMSLKLSRHVLSSVKTIKESKVESGVHVLCPSPDLLSATIIQQNSFRKLEKCSTFSIFITLLVLGISIALSKALSHRFFKFPFQLKVRPTFKPDELFQLISCICSNTIYLEGKTIAGCGRTQFESNRCYGLQLSHKCLILWLHISIIFEISIG